MVQPLSVQGFLNKYLLADETRDYSEKIRVINDFIKRDNRDNWELITERDINTYSILLDIKEQMKRDFPKVQFYERKYAGFKIEPKIPEESQVGSPFSCSIKNLTSGVLNLAKKAVSSMGTENLVVLGAGLAGLAIAGLGYWSLCYL